MAISAQVLGQGQSSGYGSLADTLEHLNANEAIQLFETTAPSPVPSPRNSHELRAIRYYLRSLGRTARLTSAAELGLRVIDDTEDLTTDEELLERAKLLSRMTAILSSAEELNAYGYINTRAYTLLQKLLPSSDPEVQKALNLVLFQRAVAMAGNLDFEMANYIIARITDEPAHYRDDYLNATLPFITGYLSLHAGDYQGAVDVYTRYLADREHLPQTLQSVFAMSSLGDAYRELGRFDEADALYRQAHEHFYQVCQKGNENQSYCSKARTMDVLRLQVSQERGDYEQADRHYVELLERGTPAITRPSVEGTFHLQGAIAAAARGQQDSANTRFTRSLRNVLVNDEVDDNGLPTIDNNTPHDAATALEWLLARFEYAASQPGARSKSLAYLVHEKIDSLLYKTSQASSIVTIRFIDKPDIREHYEAVLTMAATDMAAADQERRAALQRFLFSTVASTKDNTLRRRLPLGNLIQSDQPEVASIVRQRSRLSSAIAMLRYDLRQTKTATDISRIQDSIVRLDFQLQTINDSLSAISPAFKRSLGQVKTGTADELQALLPPDIAVIEYFVGPQKLHVVVLTATHGVHYTTLPIPASIEPLLEDQLHDTEAAVRLYDKIVAPIVDELPGEITRLQIIPDRWLWKVAFPALIHNDRYLIEDFALSFAYGWQSLGASLALPELKEQSYAGFGMSFSDVGKYVPTQYAAKRGAYMTLPLAVQEVEEVASVMDGDAFHDSLATKEAVLKCYGKRSVLHFATHGHLDTINPFNSGLVLSAEALSSDPLELLRLSEILSLPPMDATVVVLGSCHSAAGNLEAGAGLNSLARGFRLAGARSVLASRWEAEDQTTYELIVAFHAGLRDGLNTDEALAQAVRQHIAKAPVIAAGPEYWANLTLVGAIDSQPRPKNSHLPLWIIGAAVCGLIILGLSYRQRRAA